MVWFKVQGSVQGSGFRFSGRSAPANLAEGFGRYRPRDNARFVRIAIASLDESLNHLLHARKQKYVTPQEHETLTVLAKRARGASTRYLNYLESCPPNGPKRKERPPNDNNEQENPEPPVNPEPDPEP